MLKVLESENSIVNNLLSELRDKSTQKNRLIFESNIEKLGAILAFESSKLLHYEDITVETPLASKKIQVLKDDVVLATVLRAGLPLLKGVSTLYKNSDQAFISASRSEGTNDVTIDLSYLASPVLDDKVLIMVDTMLATGKSLVESYNALVNKAGEPKKIIILSVIASQPGLDYVSEKLPNVEIITCSLDKELNEDFYIVPGLGDAGDLLFGSKV